MAEILKNPVPEIYGRFKNKLVLSNVITDKRISFGNSDVGATLPWVAFKPMTNYSYIQCLDLANNEGATLVNIQIECYATKESGAMDLEDECKQAMFEMGFYSSGFNQRFKNNKVHRYISRYAMLYTGELPDLS